MSFDIVILFAQSLLDFRWPELDSCAKLLQIQLSYDRSQDQKSAILFAHVSNEQEARLLGSRCVLIRHIVHYWADGQNYDELHAALLVQPRLWAPYQHDTTFKVTSAGLNQKIKLERQRDIAEGLSFMNLQGRIDLNNPELEICVYEDHIPGHTATDWKATLRHIWCGRRICDGRRDLIDLFDVKKRAYIGNTSMESEVSLVMANMALASPGKLLYDPFAGTGSMLYTAAHFGALVLGSDVDGRPMRGHRAEKASSKNSADKSISDSATQYGVQSRLLGCLVFDLTQHPWRTDQFFDAIYGVRAGAKRIGRSKGHIREEPYVRANGRLDHTCEDYVPPFEPWPMEKVLDSLLVVSRRLLRPGGRLVYFLPTVTAEYTDDDIPQLEGLHLVANSEQSFGKWARRLITMERTSVGYSGDEQIPSRDGVLPAHADFARKYFAKFT